MVFVNRLAVQQSLGRIRSLCCTFFAVFTILVSLHNAIAGQPFTLDQQSLQWAEGQYGAGGRNRLLAWQDFLRNLDNDELVVVEKVNKFINSFTFVSDTAHWGQADYWATPSEFIASGGGDCEDFAIAKYFSLVNLGISSDKLALNYVFAARLNQSHLVLAYYPFPEMEPWVLDNLIDAIKPASQRTDLLPIYSFNASTLWEAKQGGQGKQLGNSQRIRPWRELLMRMKKR